jgi:hypothetical protein
MDNKLPNEENATATLSDWTESCLYPDTPPRMMREAPLGAPTRLMRQTTVAAPTPLTRQDSVASPSPLMRYDTIATPPPLVRQDTIDLENQIRELRDQMNIINEKLDRILLILMK